MLPTPDTSHVSYSQVYEPAEDSFLLLDTISSADETAFLHQRFATKPNNPTPLVVEVGTGSGVVIGFVTAQARTLFGVPILTAGVDINSFACSATEATVRKAVAENPCTHGHFLGTLRGDLLGPLADSQVDVLIFNPPYVPTEEVPAQDERLIVEEEGAVSASARFERDSHLLSLSYAGGRDGMEITDKLIDALPSALSARGCAYILLCAGNKPEEVKARVMEAGSEWRVLTVGDSGKQAGWEKLQIIRIWREDTERKPGPT